MAEYKKAKKPSEAESSPVVFEKQIGDFGVKFRKNGIIEVDKSYADVTVLIESSKDKSVKREEMLPSLKVITSFAINPFPTKPSLDDVDFLKVGRDLVFSLDGKEHKLDCYTHGLNFGDNVLDFKDGFFGKVSDEFNSFGDKLRSVLMSDKEFATAFRMEVARREELKKLALFLAGQAEVISREENIAKNPLALLPVFRIAQEKGVVDELIHALRSDAKSIRETEYPYEFMKELEISRPLIIVDIIEGFKRPSKHTLAMEVSRMKFEEAVKKLGEMMKINPEWNEQVEQFASDVIAAIKPIYNPKKFAETVWRQAELQSTLFSEFDKDDKGTMDKETRRAEKFLKAFIEPDRQQAKDLMLLMEAILEKCKSD
jgi:hypothetical protein